MTVTYTHEVANARLSGFSSLLVRWKGSVYKLFYKEFLIYTVLYTIVSILYRTCFHGSNKVYFEKLCLQFQSYTDLIPISFVLGFYVTLIVGRWWSQLEHLPFPDPLMLIIGANVHGADDRGKMVRRTLLRYVNIAQVLTYRCVSTAVYKRFPTMDHVVAAGIMTKSEYSLYESIKTENLKYWVPFVWFSNLLSKLRQEGRIYDDMTYKLILEELNTYRTHCGSLVNYDWISVPLVYTQVVTVAVYMFFVSTLLSRQYLDPTMNYTGHEVDLYVPIFTICQFFFYMGWLKVAEQLINPFGEDDDDFEVNWCIDRNLEISMLAVDQMYSKHPKMQRDLYWNIPNPDVPYTAASANHKVEPFMGSTFDMRLPKENVQIPENRMDLLKDINDSKQQASDDKAKLLLGIPSSKNRLDNLRLFNRQFHFDSDTTPLMTPTIKTNADDVHSSDDDDDDDAGSTTSPEPDDNVPDAGDDKQVMSETEYDDENIQKNDDNNVTNDQVIVKLEKPFNSEKTSLPKDENKLSLSSTISNNNNKTKKPLKKRNGISASATKNSSLQNETGRKPPTIRRRQDSDRENAQKRIYLTAKRKRSRNFIPAHRRAKLRHNEIWLGMGPSRLFRDSIASPDTGSMMSETDAASNPANDSPFGSSLSFANSIPSPKQLRWGFRCQARNLDSEVASLTSSMPSPTGNEATDAISIPSLPPLLELPSYPAAVTQHLVSRQRPKSNLSNVDEPIMPFTEDMRRRLQIVSNPSSPTADSPLHSRVKSQKSMESSNLLMIAEESMVVSAEDGKRIQKVHSTSNNLTGFRHQMLETKKDVKKKQMTLKREFDNLSSSSGDKLRGKQSRNPSDDSGAEGKGVRRNSSNLWNVIKSWKNKRKERKTSSGLTDENILTPVRRSNVTRSISKSEEGLCGDLSYTTTPFESMVKWESESNSPFITFKSTVSRPSFLPILSLTDNNNNVNDPITTKDVETPTKAALKTSQSDPCIDVRLSSPLLPDRVTPEREVTFEIGDKFALHSLNAEKQTDVFIS